MTKVHVRWLVQSPDRAMMLWRRPLPSYGAYKPYLAIRNSGHGGGFDFRAFWQEQLARLFENQPPRKVEFSHVTISAQQSIILATRVHPVRLRFGCFSVLGENGDALARTLQDRQSPFGYLNFSTVNCSDDKVWLRCVAYPSDSMHRWTSARWLLQWRSDSIPILLTHRNDSSGWLSWTDITASSYLTWDVISWAVLEIRLPVPFLVLLSVPSGT